MNAKRNGRAVALPRTISNDADLSQATRYLTRRCEAMHHAHRIAGLPPLRRYPHGFEGLARIVIGQQLSASAANAIHARLAARHGTITPAAILAASESELRAFGLSRPKIATLTSLASEIDAGRLDLAPPPPPPGETGTSDHSLSELRARLLALRGIGPWTVDIYEMFCLGHADGFAPGDLALAEATRRALRLDERPKPDALLQHAERWRPVRSVAAALLWAYYATGEGK